MAQFRPLIEPEDINSSGLQTLHLSLASTKAGLPKVVEAVRNAPVPANVSHHVVIRHAADSPLNVSDLVAQLSGLPPTVEEVTVLVMPANA